MARKQSRGKTMSISQEYQADRTIRPKRKAAPGWTQPGWRCWTGGKAHWFRRDRRSLCGAWVLYDNRPVDEDHGYECLTCARLLRARGGA